MTDELPPLQGGMTNEELRAAWDKKLPGVVPKDQELSAFAVGVEVGFASACALTEQSIAAAVQRERAACARKDAEIDVQAQDVGTTIDKPLKPHGPVGDHLMRRFYGPPR